MVLTYRLRDSSLVVKVLAKATDHLELLVNRQAVDSGFDDVAHGSLIDGNEAVIVHEGEETHYELAIHAVSDTTMAGDGLAKVLDVESTLQTGSKESTEGSDERSKGSESEDVELHRLNPESLVKTKQLEGEGLRDKDRVQIALQTGQDVGTQIIDRADEVLVAHQNIGHEVTKNNGANPCPKETLHGLLGGQLDELGASESDTADISEDIIRDNQRGRQEEPDHSLEDVVHHKVRLHDDQIQCHVGPGELGELEPVVTLLQRSHEENEAYSDQHEKTLKHKRTRRET